MLLDGEEQTQGITGFSYKYGKIYAHLFAGGFKKYDVEQFILTNKPTFPGGLELDGGLHFGYAKIFNSMKEYSESMRMVEYREVFTIRDPYKSLMVANGMRMFRGVEFGDLTVLSFDIETTGLDPFASDAKVLLISNTWRERGEIRHKLFAYDEFSSDCDMIQAWCDWVRTINPHIICGHNIYSFDIPYLYARGGTLGLGVDGPLEFEYGEKKFRLDQGRFLTFKMPNIPGRSCIDTLLLAYKGDTGKKLDSYGLKPIIKQLKLEKPGRVFYDGGQIRLKYRDPQEWVKIKAYAEADAWDGLEVLDYFLPPFFYLTQFIPMSLQNICISASGAQINTMLISYYLCNNHSIPQASKKRKYQGAISLGNPGIYTNVISLDVASLYPSIILQFDVCDRHKDPLHAVFNLTKQLREDRLKYKKLGQETGKKSYKDLDGSLKILINSIYGMLGTEGINFNSMDCADGVTAFGRLILRHGMAFCRGESKDIVKEYLANAKFTGRATLEKLKELEAVYV